MALFVRTVGWTLAAVVWAWCAIIMAMLLTR